jgi:hypothetical protein
MQDVAVLENTVVEQEAGSKAFTFWGAENAAAIYSSESRAVWDWANKREVAAYSASQRPNTFLLGGSVLEGLMQACTASLARVHHVTRTLCLS